MPPKSKRKEPAAKPTKSSGSQPPKKDAEQKPQPPNWPLLRPLVPASDLTLESLLEDQIYIIRNFFTSTLCKNYVSFLSSLPLVTTPGKPKKGEAVRVNDRFQVDDAAFAETLWSSTALKELVEGSLRDSDGSQATMRKMWGGEPLGLNPNIRIYRYKPGQFFAQHCKYSNDIVNDIDEIESCPGPHHSLVPLLLFPSMYCIVFLGLSPALLPLPSPPTVAPPPIHKSGIGSCITRRSSFYFEEA